MKSHTGAFILSKGYVGLRTNIADMHFQLKIILNNYADVFGVILTRTMKPLVCMKCMGF